MLPAAERLAEIGFLIEENAYFVLHAPRQSGKTTTIQAYADKINGEGKYYALYCSLESAGVWTDPDEGLRKIGFQLIDSLRGSRIPPLAAAGAAACAGRPGPASSVPGAALSAFSLPYDASIPVKSILNSVCSGLDKDLVLFFDEADSLSDDLLTAFLLQLRLGYVARAASPFPRAISLTGMRNIRDYKNKIRTDSETSGSSSPFNIIAEALSLRDFSFAEMSALYRQHTEASGQRFEDGALEAAWKWSEGQPWIVNALAREVIVKQLKKDFSVPVTQERIDTAAETIILRRDVHVDYLLAHLKTPRVRRVMDPVLTGGQLNRLSLLDDDLHFALDLGLIKEDSGTYRPSNAVYREAMPRALSMSFQISLPPDLHCRWMEGEILDMSSLLTEFQAFWRDHIGENAEFAGYKEALPHIVLSAYLQKVVNGKASVQREYQSGSYRVDFLVRYGGQAYPVELKTGRSQMSFGNSLDRLSKRMDICGACEGWLALFDHGPGEGRDKKLSWETYKIYEHQAIHVLGF
ncbi:MAG: hypothetical protein LBW85_04985 [Deltaproteobacteria bacterium]|jgi:DNA polymerase III delta prime subunit|nr:hypothetical protein [Deltaproteobacteria bacterium]